MKYKNTDRDTSAWIKECETSFSDKFFDIAEEICAKGVRVIRLFGPTCSGKTTSASILISLFSRLGKRAHVISIDDFFFDRETLERAVKSPEQYRDLVVRIGGYSDYFTRLSPEMQKEVILRTEHKI